MTCIQKNSTYKILFSLIKFLNIEDKKQLIAILDNDKIKIGTKPIYLKRIEKLKEELMNNTKLKLI